ncbi:MAG TPA: DMSO/selenate family reductase complex A subunit [Pseudonocardiaceae bacterium]
MTGTSVAAESAAAENPADRSSEHDHSRRKFLVWSGIVAGGTALASTVTRIGMPTAHADGMAGVDKTVWNACLANCASRCPLRLQVKGGTIVRVLPDSTGSDEFGDFNIRACVRGRNQRQRVYSADRIKRPMKRVGKRGSGQWQPISWDEALDTVAAQIKRIKQSYGNEAIWYHYGSGSTGGNITQRGSWPRLLNLYGGYLGYYGSYSAAQITAAAPYQYGDSAVTSNSLQDAKNSQLQVMFGNNTLETRMSGGGELAVTLKVRKDYGIRTIIIDPRYTDTAVNLGDEWVPIRPGTDPALVAALVYVMVTEGLHDQAFLDQYSIGFDEAHMPAGAPQNASYRSYLEGKGADHTAKTPEWAADITGVPADTIRRLAREIAAAKPCAITQGWGPQRQANGENSARAVYTLAAVTGNVGIPGGGTGAREGYYSLPVAKYPMFDTNPPVKTMISCFNWIDAIDHGPEMTATKDGVRGKSKLDVGIKLMVVNSSNTLINQHNDVHQTQRTLSDESKCEFIVAIDHQWTPTCDWADIVLPATTNFEETDLIPGGSCSEMGWAIQGDQVINPLFEAKTGYQICTEVATRLGLKDQFTEGRTQEQWRSWLFDQTRAKVPDFPTEAELSKLGVFRKVNPKGSTIALKDFRTDPVANPLKTPSGKIEIYSQKLDQMSKTWVFEGDRATDKLTALPEFFDPWEGAIAARTSRYPLQCIAHHFKGRTHSTYANLPWNQEAHPQVVWINTLDAKARGIANDDKVDVFNDRGRVRTTARVTERIAPGVVSVPQGAWYHPDAQGIDQGACVNTIMKYHPSPLAKGNPGHTALVDVAKVSG